MRLLDENILNTATSIEGVLNDSNYPATNLYDNSLLTTYKTESGVFSSVITITFSSNQTVSYFSMANHAGQAITVKLYNSASALLDTYAVNTSDDFIYYYASPKTTVRTITVDVTTMGADVSIGHIGFGSYIQFPYANLNPKIGHSLTGSFSKTEGGYLTGKTGVKLESFEATFDVVTLAFQTEIFTAIEALQGNTAFMLDRYEDSQTDYPPLWCNMTSLSYDGVKVRSSTMVDGLTMTFEECK